MVALDINCQLAGHSVAKSRMQQFYTLHGVDLMDAVAEQMIDYSERALRKRLEDIPDGEWSDSAAIESRENSWTVRLTLKKQGSRMVFDFTGTDPQASVGVNLPYHATFGTCFEGLVGNRGLRFTPQPRTVSAHRDHRSGGNPGQRDLSGPGFAQHHFGRRYREVPRCVGAERHAGGQRGVARRDHGAYLGRAPRSGPRA